MGRKCCSKSYSCSPCYNPCCPPFLAPCCPPPCCPPCNPCQAFCNPCYGSSCSCDSCSDCGKSYFVASSSNEIDISGQTSPYTIDFTEQQDCLNEYVNNTTFIPKCKGYYKFNVNVNVINDITTQNISVALFVNGIQKAIQTQSVAQTASQSFSLSQSLCLKRGDSVYVVIFPTSGVSLGVRTFSGSKCGSSSCSSSCCC